MFQYALTRLKTQIQSIKRCVALFKLVDNPQALQIMLKSPMLTHAGIQSILPRMTERGVT